MNYHGTTSVLNWPLHVYWPIRGVLQMFPTIDLIYDKQQSLVDTVLEEKIYNDGDITFYNIKLCDDLDDKNAIAKIPTEFALSSGDDAIIKSATNKLLHQQKDGKMIIDQIVDSLLEK